jgi:Uncharacterized protein conserved in bacteria
MLVPALHFPGTCADAIALYKKVFAAQVIAIAYNKDAPMGTMGGNPDYIMHAELVIADTRMNMCDVSDAVVSGNMYLYNIFFDTADEVIAAYNHLSAEGRVITALGPQFWNAMYADVVDKFEVHWQLMVK